MIMHWFWIGFEDTSAPAGSRARGAIIVGSTAASEAEALKQAVYHLRGAGVELSEHVECHLAEVDAVHGYPRAAWINRHLDNTEAASIAEWWTGGVASPAQIRAAFADDAARPGDPLFRPEIPDPPIDPKRGRS